MDDEEHIAKILPQRYERFKETYTIMIDNMETKPLLEDFLKLLNNTEKSLNMNEPTRGESFAATKKVISYKNRGKKGDAKVSNKW